MSEWVQEILVYPVALIALELVVVLFQKFLARRRESAAEKKDAEMVKVIEGLELGVEAAWEEAGKAYKAAAKDRKLTDEEKVQLRGIAIDVANEHLKPAGLDVLKAVGMRFAKNLIKRIVERRKLEGADVREASDKLRAAIKETAPDA